MRLRTLVALLLATLVSSTVTALPRTTEEVASKSASLAAGWESTWVTVAGYGVGLPGWLGARGTVWRSELVFPVTVLPSLKVGTGLHALFAPERGFGLGAHAGVDLGWALDKTGTKFGLGGRAALRPGYYAPQWSAAADLGWRSSLLTFVSHSDEIETLYDDRYPDEAEVAGGVDGPRDGLIGPQSNRLQFGAAAAWSLSDAVKLTLRGGFEWTPTAPGISSAVPVSPLPFYSVLGGAFRW